MTPASRNPSPHLQAASAPSGDRAARATLTFLFTDIEGSTRLWEEHPLAMRKALAWHNALLREAIEGNHGHIFKTMGDAFCAAFPTPTGAAAAALAAQRALGGAVAAHQQPEGPPSEEDWPAPPVGPPGPSFTTPLTLRVRMALHTGDAEEVEGDYFGPSVNRVARLLAAGHGGQTLISAVTAERLAGDLPPGARLRDLGEYHVKGLGDPVRIFQLEHGDLSPVDAPLRSLQAFRHNLPPQLTSFVGRDREVREVTQRLNDTRLLTLGGAGGCGKSRLALQVAGELAEEYRDGAWLVELASLSDPSLAVQAVAAAVGLREEAGRPLLETIAAGLEARQLLLLLDNCEHLLPACAELAEAILRRCPWVRILATSREHLNIPGELTYRVPSLDVPGPAHATSVEDLAAHGAVRLFLDRAVVHQPSFRLTPENAPAIAQICRLLDGIPLAIELAAARARALSAEEIQARLDDRFRLLTGGSRTALPRHQTLRAALDWSYEPLTRGERLLLARLSVFAGGWTLAAAEAVCGSDGVMEWWSEGDLKPTLHHSTTPPLRSEDVLDLLTCLVDKSLVVMEERGGAARYRFLETVRQYARARLEEGEPPEGGPHAAAGVQARHVAFFLRQAQEAGPRCNGPDQSTWFSRLEADHDNFRAALDACARVAPGTPEHAHAADAALRLVVALRHFTIGRGYLAEGRARLEQVLGMAGEREELRGSPGEARALNAAGIIACMQGDYPVSRAWFEQALAIWRALGDRRGIAALLDNLGNVAAAERDHDAARALQAESLAIEREIGDPHAIACALNNLGKGALSQGDHAGARSMHEEALQLRRQVGDPRETVASLNNLGRVTCRQGEHAAARAYLAESLTLVSAIDDPWNAAYAVEYTAWLAAAQTRAPEGARRATLLMGAIEALRERVGSSLPGDERDEHERQLAAARAALGERAFTAALAEGRAWALDQALSAALEETAG